MSREFEFGLAERLLRDENNGGWQLPENSDFEFNKADGLKHKQPKSGSKEPQK